MPKRLQLEFPSGLRVDLLGTKELPDDVTMRDGLVELGECISKVYGDGRCRDHPPARYLNDRLT